MYALASHAFVRPDGHRIVVVWNRTSADEVTLRSAGAYAAVSEHGLDGRATTIAQNSALRLRLRAGVPQILRLRAR